jgi:hypothetical protein
MKPILPRDFGPINAAIIYLGLRIVRHRSEERLDQLWPQSNGIDDLAVSGQ